MQHLTKWSPVWSPRCAIFKHKTRSKILVADNQKVTHFPLLNAPNIAQRAQNQVRPRNEVKEHHYDAILVSERLQWDFIERLDWAETKGNQVGRQFLDKEREYKTERLVHVETCGGYERKVSEMTEEWMGREWSWRR